MKTEFRLQRHPFIPGADMIEIWYAGTFVGQVTALQHDGPGVRVVSMHPLAIDYDGDNRSRVAILHVGITLAEP